MIKGDSVDASALLLRRTFRTDRKYIDLKTGRPTSRAFAPRPKDNGRLSVNIKELTTYAASIQDIQKFKLFEIFASLVYECKLKCMFDPLDDNPAHALITGFDSEDESLPGSLARNSREVIDNF